MKRRHEYKADFIIDEFPSSSQAKIHAEVCAMADKFDILDLLEFARSNFSIHIRGCWTDELLEIMKFVCTTIPLSRHDFCSELAGAYTDKLGVIKDDDGIYGILSQFGDMGVPIVREMSHRAQQHERMLLDMLDEEKEERKETQRRFDDLQTRVRNVFLAKGMFLEATKFSRTAPAADAD